MEGDAAEEAPLVRKETTATPLKVTAGYSMILLSLFVLICSVFAVLLIMLDMLDQRRLICGLWMLPLVTWLVSSF